MCLIFSPLLLSEDYINTHKLAQDHPCVLNIIRNKFMNQPVSRDVPYNLEDSSKIKTINDTEIKHLLKNKVGLNYLLLAVNKGSSFVFA